MSAKSADNRSASRSGAGSSGESPRGTDGGSSASGDRAEDVALVCGLTDDGHGVEVIRKRGERVETGTVRRLEPGKPIHGEVVRLRPRSHAPLICDIDVELEAPGRAAADAPHGASPALAASSGPAQVATESYRKNWDAVYGRGRKAPLLN